MVAEEVVYLVGDYERRTTGLHPDGKLACFERGGTTRFRQECPVFPEKQKTYKGVR